MRVYFKMMLLNLESQMQYKISFVMTIIGQFVTAFTGLIGIKFMFGYIDSVGEFGYYDVMLCFGIITLVFAIGEALGGGMAVFAGVLGNGEFDRALVRPRSTLFQILASRVDFTRAGLLIQAICVLAYVLPKSGIIWDWKKIVTLILMIGCGSVLFFALFVFKATFSFFTVQNLDFMNIFTYGAREYGKYPFGIYGKRILHFLTFLIPLALVQHYPLLYLIGKRNEDYYMFLPLLSLLFLIPCYLFFSFGIKKYKSTGS